VTLFYLAESRLRRFQQNPARWLRLAASERRGFHSRGKPLGQRFEQNYLRCLRSAAGEKRGFRPRGEPSASHVVALLDAPLLSSIGITTLGAPGVSGDSHSLYATPSSAARTRAPPESHTATSLDAALLSAFDVVTQGAPGVSGARRPRGEPSPFADHTPSPVRGSGLPYTVLAQSRSSHSTPPHTPRYNPITT
jgi:hypothetical protein